MGKPTGTIKFAKFEDSERLQRFLYLMLDGRERTGLEVIHGADITAVSAAACELRRNGFDMICIQKKEPSIYKLFNPDYALMLADNLLNLRRAA